MSSLAWGAVSCSFPSTGRWGLPETRKQEVCALGPRMSLLRVQTGRRQNCEGSSSFPKSLGDVTSRAHVWQVLCAGDSGKPFWCTGPFNLHTIRSLTYNSCPHSADEETEAIEVHELAQDLAVRKR